MITVTRPKKRKAVRGPKYPPGIGVRKILLIALDYPDGISESELIEKIQEKLPLRSKKGIKAHLDDLGPGRTIRKKWKQGMQYLIKIPSKFEFNEIKARLLKILEAQGIEIDSTELPEESFWKPDPERIVELSRYILEEPNLDEEDTQHLRDNEFILNCVATSHSKLFEDNEAFEELKTMLKVSPRMFELCLKIDDLGTRYVMGHSNYSFHGFSDSVAQEVSTDRTRYFRWELFRSCLETDTGFLEKEEISLHGKLYEMVETENRKRLKVENDYIYSLMEKRA